MDDKNVIGLSDNSQSALLAAIEIHNKPLFPYRYEVSVILLINAWELLLKAFLIERRPEIKIINEDGTTKAFEGCVTNVLSTIGKDFLTTSENIDRLYDYRCNMTHFYQENIDVVLYSLISKSVILYHEFLLSNFGIDISERANLVLLPIGFKAPISPIDFLAVESKTGESSEHVRKYLLSIVESTKKLEEEGIQDAIIMNYKMAVFNENRIKNADIIAGITKDSSKAAVVVENLKAFTITDDDKAQRIKIEEDNLFKNVYTLTFKQVTDNCRKQYSDFKMNTAFYSLLSEIKKNPKLHRTRYLDVGKETGLKKDYYSNSVFAEFDKHYTRKDRE